MPKAGSQAYIWQYVKDWRAVADELAEALRQMYPATHYRAKLRAEALAHWKEQTAQYDGSETL